MDSQNPIQDAAPQPEEKDESQVSQRHWPWIVAGLCIMLGIVYKDSKEKDAIILKNSNDRVNDTKELAAAWQEVAKERRDLKAIMSYLVHYTNDTAIVSRIDSVRKSEQSGR